MVDSGTADQSERRAGIQAELTELAETMLAGWDSYNLLLEEADIGYVAKKFKG